MKATYNERIKAAGIKTIRTEDEKNFRAVKLEHNGKQILRGCASTIIQRIKKEFNLSI